MCHFVRHFHTTFHNSDAGKKLSGRVYILVGLAIVSNVYDMSIKKIPVMGASIETNIADISSLLMAISLVTMALMIVVTIHENVKAQKKDLEEIADSPSTSNDGEAKFGDENPDIHELIKSRTNAGALMSSITCIVYFWAPLGINIWLVYLWWGTISGTLGSLWGGIGM